MTALVVHLCPERGVLATDGAAVQPDGTITTALKAFPLPHASCVLSGQGPLVLMAWVAFMLAQAVRFNSIDDVLPSMPDIWRNAYAQLKDPKTFGGFSENPPMAGPVMLGWSESGGRVIGRSWFSWEEFSENVIEDGESCTGGGETFLPMNPVDADFFAVVSAIRDRVRSEYPGTIDALGIGGRVMLYEVARQRVDCRTLGALA